MNRKTSTGQLIFLIVYVMLCSALVLFISGDWLWLEGWIFAGWLVLTVGITATYLYFKDPALLAERFRKTGTGGQMTWDKHVITAIRLIFMASLILMPLDAKRFNWSANFPFFLKLIGIAFLLIASFFLFRSFKDNTFLSPLVRIQTERKQQLVTTGVYGIIRHPMYLGMLLMFIGIPLLLSSYIGLALGLITIVLAAFRAIGEERMLMREFEDYAAYKKKVKFRFIPFIW
jgi:protein-S-isoprenylcysteine O-methyltransferase Ste14